MAYRLRSRIDAAREATGEATRCPCTIPEAARVEIVERDGDGNEIASGDLGPCPRCGAPPVRVEIVEADMTKIPPAA